LNRLMVRFQINEGNFHATFTFRRMRAGFPATMA
jgi:hypothetical protein